MFSNLPQPRVRPRSDSRSAILGMFEYSHEHVASGLVLDAVGLLKQRRLRVTLRLLGGPDRSSAPAEALLAAAADRGLEHTVDFSGILSAQDPSDALASCTILLFAHTVGPVSLNGTLAASFACGVPLVAIDGPDCWPKLRQSEATRVVVPTSHALAESIQSLLADEQLRDQLGMRGRLLAEREMSIARTANMVTDLLDNLRVRATTQWRGVSSYQCGM